MENSDEELVDYEEEEYLYRPNKRPRTQPPTRSPTHDRISEMPDSILIHILSLLPTKDSVKTGVLSRRWHRLWTLVPTLTFNDHDACGDEEHDKFVSFVDTTLLLHKCSKLKRFSVEFEYESREASRVDMWVRFATMADVEELSLDFKWSNSYINHEILSEYSYKLPRHMYDNSTITKLGLSLCEVGCVGLINWKWLKSLSIGFVKLSEDLIRKVFAGCPVLESLELYKFFGIDRLIVNSSSLRKLALKDYWDDSDNDDDYSEFEICGSCLRSLEISGNMNTKKFRVTNGGSLIVCILNFVLTTYGSDYEVAQDVLRQLLERVRHVKKLALGYWCFQVMTMLEMKNVHFHLFKCNYLVLNLRMKQSDLCGIVNLLQSSPSLETLVIKVSSHHYSQQLFEEVPKDFLTSLEGVSLWHLKTVQIIDFRHSGSELLVQLAKLVLENARLLKKFVIAAIKDGSRKGLFEVAQKLLSIPRSSTRAMIMFTG